MCCSMNSKQGVINCQIYQTMLLSYVGMYIKEIMKMIRSGVTNNDTSQISLICIQSSARLLKLLEYIYFNGSLLFIPNCIVQYNGYIFTVFIQNQLSTPVPVIVLCICSLKAMKHYCNLTTLYPYHNLITIDTSKYRHCYLALFA